MGGQGQHMFPPVTQYLDDYLLVGPRGTSDQLEVFQVLEAKTSVPLAAQKTEGPATSLPFLGILLDSIQGISSLTLDKLTTYLRQNTRKNVPLRRYNPFGVT